MGHRRHLVIDRALGHPPEIVLVSSFDLDTSLQKEEQERTFVERYLHAHGYVGSASVDRTGTHHAALPVTAQYPSPLHCVNDESIRMRMLF